MHKLKSLYFLIIVLPLFASCIKRYDPDIKRADVLKYVVTGGVNAGSDRQNVSVSVTTPFFNPKYVPVIGCKVTIIDGKGNSYSATEIENGNYEAIIPQSELITGSIFKVDIEVPGGTHIISDFDRINDCPEVDSIYYTLKAIPKANPYFTTKGIQFYMDFDAGKVTCPNYRFDAVETWEYTANLAKEAGHKVCWVSSPLRSVYTLTTKNQTKNIYKGYPLHFVDNYTSQRLRYMYSLLFRQYSLSDTAYSYWEKMRINFDDQGGLYENQPAQVIGNLHNLTHPDQQVLGYFGASTMRTKRIFVYDVPGLTIEYLDCKPVSWPEILNPECEDCLASVGGTNVKPVYWPR